MILVTGGTGTAGGEVISQLASTGTPFRAMVRSPEKAASLALKLTGVQIVPGDLAKPETLPGALRDIDQVFLLCAPVPNQFELERNMVVAAKAAGVRHIVKQSAMTADPNSRARFPRIHGQVEQLIRESGLEWTFLRPTFFMQNLLGLADMVKAGTIYQPAGDSKAGFVDVEDIAAVAVEALTEPGHAGYAYEITGPELLSYHDIARILSETIGKPVGYQDIPPAAARQAMRAVGLPEWNVDGILELMDQMRAGEYERLSDAVSEVGKKDPNRFKDFVRQYAETFKGAK